MRNLLFTFRLAAVLLLYAAYSHAQLTPPVNMRAQYAQEQYRFTEQQFEAYSKELAAVLDKWDELKNKIMPQGQRKAAEQKLQEELCIRVKGVLPNEQYEQWYRNHRGNLTVRFYKEDLGMDNAQFALFEKLTDAYSAQNLEIERMNHLLEAERAERRDAALEQYANGLNQILPKSSVDYLIYEDKVQTVAKRQSKGYTIIPESKAIRYAELKIKHEEDRLLLKKQKLPKNQHRAARKKQDADYEKAVLSVISREEYVAIGKERNRINDRKMMQQYHLSEAQLAQYKELKKQLAVKEQLIRQNKKNKAGRAEKMKAAQAWFDEEAKKLLGASQHERWKKNGEMKKQKKEKKRNK